MNKYLFIAALLIIPVGLLLAQEDPACALTPTYKTDSNGTGNWDTANSWDPNVLPPYTRVNGAITIPAGHIVEINNNFTLNATDLIIEGTLVINGKLDLSANQGVSVPTGGKIICCSGGCNPSEKLRIGSMEVWNGDDGTVNGPIGYGTLPVKLISFQGSYADQKINLSWTSATEINFNRYVIERSRDGVAFIEVGAVDGKGGDQVAATYAYQDAVTASGYYYYRLKQVDKDETFSYSRIIAVYAGDQGTGIHIWPNPVHGRNLHVTCSLDQSNLTLMLYDITGNKRFTTLLTGGDNSIQLDQSLPAGVYLARIAGALQPMTLRVTLVD